VPIERLVVLRTSEVLLVTKNIQSTVRRGELFGRYIGLERLL
jgi:hypothetical protein